MTEPLRELIASYIRNWGPESPDEPGAADRLADLIIQEVLDAHRVTRPTLRRAIERVATVMEQDYLDRRGKGARLPKVRS